jgi:hypothetical protein
VKNLKANVTRGWASVMDEAANGRVVTRNVPDWLEVVGRTYNGAKITNPGRIVEKPDRVEVVREIFRLACLGIGSESIARQLNGRVLTRGWVVHTLCNRAVLGEFRPRKNGNVIENYFPAIITQSVFDAARQQMNSKKRNGDFAGGRRSDTASNLFSGLMYDVTPSPERTLQFQQVRRGRYLMSAFDKVRPQNRTNYDRFEHAFMTFFSEADWKEIAGARESDELRAAKIDLEKVLGDLDKVARRIETTNGLIDSGDLSSSALSAAFERLGKDQATLSTLSDQKDALQVKVDAERATCSALDDSETLLELIRQNGPGATEIRLKLRAEIRRRVHRIDVTFKDGILSTAVITLISGYADKILFGQRP